MNPIARGCDKLVDWAMEEIAPILLVGGMGLAFIGIVALGWMAWRDFAPPSVKGEPAITIRTQYWSCTAAYIYNHPRQSRSIKFGGGYYEAYDECLCKQWTAHMVGQEPAAEAVCTNGWSPLRDK